MSKDKAVTLREIQKQLKKDLYKLKIKICYYQQSGESYSEVAKLKEIFDYKKKKLFFIRYLRKSLSRKILKEA
jgi:radical SAM superfamily enzyme